jgi:hypothetical protein
MKMLFLFLLVSSSVFAQSSEPAKGSSEVELPAWSFQKLKERVRINYFAETFGPNIVKWDDNEVNSDGTRSNLPMRTFHSFNNQVKLFDANYFILSARFVTVIGDRNELTDRDDTNVFQMDDWQIGFGRDFIKTKTFTYAQRLTHRHPFSTYSKNSGIDSQIEWTHTVNWALAPKWRILHWNNYRYYVYNAETESERYRINFNTILNYDINDKWRTQLMYEWDMQHRNPSKGPKKQDWNYFKVYENHLSWGIGYNPFDGWSVIPFIRAMELADIRKENTIVGLWILGKVF